MIMIAAMLGFLLRSENIWWTILQLEFISVSTFFICICIQLATIESWGVFITFLTLCWDTCSLPRVGWRSTLVFSRPVLFKLFHLRNPFSGGNISRNPTPYLELLILAKIYMTRMSWSYAPFYLQSILFQNLILVFKYYIHSLILLRKSVNIITKTYKRPKFLSILSIFHGTPETPSPNPSVYHGTQSENHCSRLLSMISVRAGRCGLRSIQWFIFF
jgi:hypothetical protein